MYVRGLLDLIKANFICDTNYFPLNILRILGKQSIPRGDRNSPNPTPVEILDHYFTISYLLLCSTQGCIFIFCFTNYFSLCKPTSFHLFYVSPH